MVNYLVWCYHIERQNLAVSDGKHCVYCGEEVKNVGMVLRSLCYSSQNKKYALDK